MAAIRLLTLTGARLSEILNLTWKEIGEPGEDGASIRLEDSKTGPRTVWLGPEAASVLAALPRTEQATPVFPEELTSSRVYTFWVTIRDEAGLPGLRIYDCRHTWASQGVMNGVGLAAVGRLLGHRQPDTTAIYAHLDDATLGDAAAQAAEVIACAMRYTAGPSLAPEGSAESDSAVRCDGRDTAKPRKVPAGPLDLGESTAGRGNPDAIGTRESANAPVERRDTDWLARDRFGADCKTAVGDALTTSCQGWNVDWL